MVSIFGSRNKLESTHTIVLFDRKNGEIKHTHEEFFFANLKTPERNEIEIKVRDIAKKLNNDTSNLDALPITDIKMDSSKIYKVDINNNQLIIIGDRKIRTKKI